MLENENISDDKQFSRKWMLAKTVLKISTAQHLCLQLLVFWAMIAGKLPPDAWVRGAENLLMGWVWSVGSVLALYGLANVAAIKFRADGSTG